MPEELRRVVADVEGNALPKWKIGTMVKLRAPGTPTPALFVKEEKKKRSRPFCFCDYILARGGGLRLTITIRLPYDYLAMQGK
jgi:hypothetical protein